jgi:hypothetical protein
MKAPFKRLRFENTPSDSLLLITKMQTAKNSTILSTYNKIGNSRITQISENNTLTKKIYDYYNSSIIYFNSMIDYEEQIIFKMMDYWVFEQNIFELNDLPGFPSFQRAEQFRKGLLKLLSEPSGI